MINADPVRYNTNAKQHFKARCNRPHTNEAGILMWHILYQYGAGS